MLKSFVTVFLHYLFACFGAVDIDFERTFNV